MKIEIVFASKALRSYEQEWVDTYIRRASRFAEISLIRVKENLGAAPLDRAEKTWREMEKRLSPSGHRVVLDSIGSLLSTEKLSHFFDRIEKSGRPRLSFVVGGSYGLPDSARASVELVWSLSPLTLPHRLALLVLTEQLYRVLSWRAGSPYHHE